MSSSPATPASAARTDGSGLVTVLFFAAAKDVAGAASVEIAIADVGVDAGAGALQHGPRQIPPSIAPAVSLADLVEHLLARFPDLKPLLASMMVAVNLDYAPLESWLPARLAVAGGQPREPLWVRPGDEVALIPPVSGG
ncbi:uncharacterized protein BJ171DRAFT_525132 [Polychytrium aggregatum]|uniref:uncharacterized protein n=1 Tax=Polychytrium aggregatum TaxID=110093 RepID=UPI0022FEB5A3|nr:uncharacterized protein BJ171DRAFT_525132 [Polychytrium aggregatum]KAI9193587.1 hypothetical protein BJ171DRAFT_525132 [Polychytrium aggregatum]